MCVSQTIQHWLDQSLKLLRVLVEDSLFRVVRPRIVKDLLDVDLEVIDATIGPHVNLAILVWLLHLFELLGCQLFASTYPHSPLHLLLDRLEVHWSLDHVVVISDLFAINGFSEWPRILMRHEHI